MIFGAYPCCDGPLALALPDGELPRYAPEACPHCGARVWHKFSRLVPESWTEKDFLAEFIVDEAGKRVTPRKEPTALEIAAAKIAAESVAGMLVEEILHGNGSEGKPLGLFRGDTTWTGRR